MFRYFPLYRIGLRPVSYITTKRLIMATPSVPAMHLDEVTGEMVSKT
jgi:hypothetical protein